MTGVLVLEVVVCTSINSGSLGDGSRSNAGGGCICSSNCGGSRKGSIGGG